MSILESKLSYNDRKELPDKEFGLPEHRKYPLNDEAHVRSAIRFFKYAKVNERRELAKNINMKLKTFDMKVNVGKDNPFHKYVNKEYLNLTESVMENNNIYDYTPGSNINPVFDKVIIDLMTAVSTNLTDDLLLRMEKRICEIIHNNADFSTEFHNFIYAVNEIFSIAYRDYFDLHCYNYGEYISPLYYGFLDDVRNTMNGKNDLSDNRVREISNIFDQFINTISNHNWFYVDRVCTEIYYSALYYDRDITLFERFNKPLPTSTTNIFVECQNHNLFDSKCIDYTQTRQILDWQRKQLENEIYIINKNKEINLNYKENKDIFYADLITVENEDIKKKISNLYKFIAKTDIVKFIKGNITLELDAADFMLLKDNKYISQIISGASRTNEKLWYGVKDNIIYLIAKCKDEEKLTYKLLEINDDVYNYFLYHSPNPKTKLITLQYLEKNQTFEELTEGFSVNENGDIKITINPKKSYMEEYMETHRILVENYKNKNYDAMKQNVAFMFLLISIIEKDKKYKDRESEIVKARAFAINDFKTYLSYIQKEEPKFNFENYYKNLGLDKYVINIPKETILGIRNLLKTILL